MTPMLSPAQFRWAVPTEFNLAEVCCARWARLTPHAVAIRYEHEDGARANYSFAQLQQSANQLSMALRRQGVERGDRVAVVMPQRFETAVAHMALYQLGAVAMPLSMLFGPEALEYRLNNSEAVLAIADESSIANVRAARRNCPDLGCVIVIDARDLISNAFYVVVERGTVYLMGRVSEREAKRASDIARAVGGVNKVVRAFEIISEEELARLTPKQSAQ